MTRNPSGTGGAQSGSGSSSSTSSSGSAHSGGNASNTGGAGTGGEVALGGDSSWGGANLGGMGGQPVVIPPISAELLKPGSECVAGGVAVTQYQREVFCHGEADFYCDISHQGGFTFKVSCGEFDFETAALDALPGMQYAGETAQHPQSPETGTFFTFKDRDALCSWDGDAWNVFAAGPSMDPLEMCQPLPFDVILVNAKASSAGDGTTWETAFSKLHDALECVRTAATDRCAAAKEIWLATGVYYPDDSESDISIADDTTVPFELVEGVALRGGFLVGDLRATAAKPTTQPSVLSGDIDQNDDAAVVDEHGVLASWSGTKGDNAERVVLLNQTGSATTAISGITITAASGTLPGAGFYCNGASASCRPTFDWVDFRGNRGSSGAGLYLMTHKATLKNVRFIQNRSSGSGGGFYSRDADAIRYYNLTFLGNRADGNGGGLFFYSSSVINGALSNALFAGNSALGAGGGVYFNRVRGTVYHSTFYNNTALDHGHNLSGTSTLRIVHSIVWHSLPVHISSEFSGSALYCHDSIVRGGSGAAWQADTVARSFDEYIGCAEANPLFSDADGADNDLGTADDDFSLKPLSGAVDFTSLTFGPGTSSDWQKDLADIDNDGITNEALPLDITAQNPRVCAAGIVGDLPDAGAFELCP